jgi:hypothetical protein
MTNSSKVDFFKETIRIRADVYGQAALTAIALRITERAKVNIVQNDQVDTGAMLNGIYAAWPGGASVGGIDPAPLPGDGPRALVAGAMEYTIWQEYENAFLYPAFVATAQETRTILETVSL